MTTLDFSGNLVSLARSICDIESVSGNEQILADAIEQALSARPHLRVKRDGNAVIARTELGRDFRVAIAGHIDTVPIADNFPSKLLSFEREQVLWGRGSVDMKAGVAVMLSLAVKLAEPRFDITWIFYDQEEIESDKNGLGRLARNHPEQLQADFAVLCEPTAGFIEGGCNGTMRVEVAISGVKAHSARPWMGENAIHAAAPLLQQLATIEPPTINVAGLDYRESLNAVLISGGVATNVIPDLCTVTINYRFAPSRSATDATAQLKEWLPGYDFRVTDVAEGASPGLDLPAAEEFIASLGRPARPKYGWTDVARFSALGIPAVNFGPGDPSKAHADDEAVPVGQLYDCEAALTAWLQG